MKKSSSSRSIMILSLIAIVAVSSAFFLFPEVSKAQSEEKVFVTHTGGIVKNHRRSN